MSTTDIHLYFFLLYLLSSHLFIFRQHVEKNLHQIFIKIQRNRVNDVILPFDTPFFRFDIVFPSFAFTIFIVFIYLM
jgi:hypothetical protein